MENEKEIIKRAKSNIQDFDYMYEKYFSQIFRFVINRTQQRDIAEEIVSNVFYKAMSKLALFKWRSIPFSAWLYRIAISEIGNYFRKQNKQSKIKEDLQIEKNIPQKEYNEFSYDFIHQYLEKLSQNDQNIIYLRFFEKKSFAEISQIIGKRENTLRVILHRALKKLETIIPEEVLENVYREVS